MLKKLMLSAVVAASGGVALADSPQPVAEPAVIAPPAFDWSGGYAGIQMGLLDSDMTLSGQNLTSGATMSSSDIDASGLVGGIYAGYNWQRGTNLVYGIEGEINLSDADKTGAGVPAPGFGFLRGSVSSEIKSTGALRGRIGYAAGQALFYAAGGLAYADFRIDGTPAGGGSPFGYSEDRWGWTLGGGVEYALMQNWVARIDYRYSDFGSDSFNFTSAAATPHTFKAKAETHEIKVGIAYRF